MLPNNINLLIESFTKFAGVGRKGATKLSLDYINMPQEQQLELLKAMLDVNKNLGRCPDCFFFTEGGSLCQFCRDGEARKRDTSKILVIQTSSDALPVEEAGIYKGLYHVLGSLVAPLDGIGPRDTTLTDLELRVERWVAQKNQKEMVNEKLEIIFYLKNSFNGDTTMAYFNDYLKDKKWKDRVIVSKLGQGLPANFNSSSVDSETLKQAFLGRR
jgi:recombination protein RecR